MTSGRFRILGPVEVEGPAGTVRIPPGRQLVILASLLVEANQVVSTEHLVDTLWDDQPPDTARTQVQICVSRLRKILSDAGVDVPILTRPPGYQLRIDESSLDMHAFTGKLAEARVLAKEGRAADTAALLRSAVALWRGPCLSGISSRPLRTRALRLEEDRLNAIETYLELELGLGRHHELIGEITRLVHEHPLRERLRALLMLALYRSGRQAEALDTYRSARDLLIDELGLEPGEELRLLENAILTGDPSLQRSTAESDAGAPRDPAESGMVRRTERPRQLPADTADFLADDKLIAMAENVLVGGERRRAVGVVVIVGRPGVGKSAMATHIGHRVAEDHFPDGQLYCDLRGVRPDAGAAADVLGRFLLALGIPGPVIPVGLDERIELYRTLLASRRVLVVLDDAVTESQVLPLLPGSSSCAVIITTRARLTGVPGARKVELDVLDATQSLHLLGQMIGTQRMDREPEAAAALVRTVGGLPLALRIIGARLAARPHWTIASMVHRLANERRRLDELSHGDMTIRASLTLTYDSLDRSSRTLFGLLSMAEGLTLPGWSAGAVLDDDHVYPSDLLEPLVDVQMLDVAAVENTGEFRYRYQDIVRLFARERLAVQTGQDEQRAALQRLVGGWLALAEQAHRRIYGGDFTVLHGTAPRWQPPADYVTRVLANPLDWMDGERDNLCAAVSQAARAGLVEACWDLAVTMVTLFEARGYLDDWERTHEDALVATRQAGDVRGTAALLSSLGTLHITRGQPGRSRAALDAALSMFEQIDDPRGLALCHRDLGLLDRQAGDDDGSYARYELALKEYARAGDVVGRAIVLTQSAPILTRRGDIGAAHSRLGEAMEIYHTVGYAGGIAHTLRRIGQLHLMAGEHETAATTMTEVLGMVRQSRDVIGEGYLLSDLGGVNALAGRLDQARAFFDQALVLREQIMDAVGAAQVRMELAKVLVAMGETGRAGELLAQAAATFGERGMEREALSARQELALLRPGGADLS